MPLPTAFWSPGPQELILVLLALLLLFGGRKLPELARALGRSINEFRRGVREIGDDLDADAEPKKLEKPDDTKANGGTEQSG